MFASRNEYDRGINTFSPEGRLIQVEYAIETIKLGSTAVGIKCVDGVVLAVERRITSKLVVPSSTKKISQIQDHCACAMSGLISDARTLVEHARSQAEAHWFKYNEPIPLETVTNSISRLAMSFGDEDDGEKTKKMSRPFGVAFLIAGVDSDGPKLFHLDPSGTYLSYDAKAIGSGSETAKDNLKNSYNKNHTVKEGSQLAVQILKDVMEDPVSSTNIEIGLITFKEKFRFLSVQELEELVTALNRAPTI